MNRPYRDNDLLEAAYDGLGALAKVCAYVGAAALAGAALYVFLCLGVGA